MNLKSMLSQYAVKLVKELNEIKISDFDTRMKKDSVMMEIIKAKTNVQKTKAIEKAEKFISSL